MTVPRIGYFYVNGVLPTEDINNKTISKIKDIIKNSDCFNNSAVYLFLNDSVTVHRFYAVALQGGIAVIPALMGEIGSVRENLMTVATFHSRQVEKQVDQMAKTLAERVSAFLLADSSRVVNLVLHSQGADIGQKAIKILEEHKDRIRVVTLGGKQTISPEACAAVVNFQFHNDLVSKTARKFFKDSGNSVIVLQSKKEYEHDALAYLENHDVQKALVDLLK